MWSSQCANMLPLDLCTLAPALLHPSQTRQLNNKFCIQLKTEPIILVPCLLNCTYSTNSACVLYTPFLDKPLAMLQCPHTRDTDRSRPYGPLAQTAAIFQSQPHSPAGRNPLSYRQKSFRTVRTEFPLDRLCGG
jgi:hypothetical protein